MDEPWALSLPFGTLPPALLLAWTLPNAPKMFENHTYGIIIGLKLVPVFRRVT